MKLKLAHVNILPTIPSLTHALERAMRRNQEAAAAYYVAYFRPAPWPRTKRNLIHNGRKPKNVKNLHNQECAQ